MMTDNITVMLVTLNRGIENNKNIWKEHKSYFLNPESVVIGYRKPLILQTMNNIRPNS